MHKNTSCQGRTPDNIRELLKKAVTEMLLLLVLRRKPMYTYEIMREIETLSGGAIVFNTLYQAIYRLQGFAYIREDRKDVVDNRVRIYFAITPEGEAYLEQLIAEYQDFTGTVCRILDLNRNETAQKTDIPKKETGGDHD